MDTNPQDTTTIQNSFDYEAVGGRSGEVDTSGDEGGVKQSGDFHRARVTLEASRPLVYFVTLAPEGCEPMLL